MRSHVPRPGRSLSLIVFLLVICAPALAQYQDNLGGNWNNPTSATITNIIMDRYARRRPEHKPGAKRAIAGGTSTIASEGAGRGSKIDDTAVHFHSTGTQLKTREIANLIDSTNPQVFALLTFILQEFDKKAKQVGRPNDLTLALGFFFATNASIYHDGGVPPDAQVLELRDTIAAALVESNALAGVGDRQKQEMYEALVLYTGLALATYQEGKDGHYSESLKIGQQLAGMNLQTVTGISPDKISFTDQGLSIEREAAAVAGPVVAPRAVESPGPLAIEHYVLLRAYQDNQIAADARYTGKRVTIVGPLDFVRMENGKPLIRMSVPAWATSQMFCFFPLSQNPALAPLKANQRIVMECTSRGLAGGFAGGRLTLDNCTLK